ncbi:MAG: GNAT family N-acetyltransferase [Candidatus Binatia bacterium]
MKASRPVNIRRFQTRDLKQIADIMAWSFKDKFQRLAPLPQDDMSDFLAKAGVIYPSPFPGYLVAEDEGQGEVLGVMVLKWAKQDRPPAKPEWSKAGKYGWIKLGKLLIGLSLLVESNPHDGECYIEHITVRADARGAGIGTQLLEFGKAFTVQNGFKEYTLHVAASNESVIKLYEKLGFKIVRRERSLLSKWLFDIEEWYYMSQECHIAVKGADEGR